MSVSLTSNFLANARGVTFKDGGGITWSMDLNTNAISADGSSAGADAGNPTAKVGLTAVDGTATTFLRSDGAPPVDQTIAPTWTGLHTFAGGLTVSAGAVTLGSYTLALSANASVGGTNTGDQVLPAAADPSATAGLSAVNGSATTFLRSDGAPAISQSIAPTWTGIHTHSPVTSATPQWVLNSSNTESYADAHIVRSGSTANTIATGPNIILADGDSSYCIQGSGGQLEFWLNTGSWAQVLGITGIPTTGSKTAAMTATNKPGSNNQTAPAAWLPIVYGAGTVGYIPVYGA